MKTARGVELGRAIVCSALSALLCVWLVPAAWATELESAPVPSETTDGDSAGVQDGAGGEAGTGQEDELEGDVDAEGPASEGSIGDLDSGKERALSRTWFPIRLQQRKIVSCLRKTKRLPCRRKSPLGSRMQPM